MRGIFTVAFLCITSVFISNTNTYVLLAANLEDFKSLAKKIVPEKLALQLADIAAASSVKHKQPAFDEKEEESEYNDEFKESEEEDYEEENETDDLKILARNSNTNDVRVRNHALSRLIFEDLVQKVKERIEYDLINKNLSPSQLNNRQDSYNQGNAPVKSAQNTYNNKAVLAPVDMKQRDISKIPDKSKYTGKHPKKNRSYEIDALPSPYTKKEENQHGHENNENSYYKHENADNEAVNYPMAEEDPGMQFAKITMLKNDSYEDYVIPDKERDRYASEERKPNDNVTPTEITQMEIVPLAKETDSESKQDKEYEVEEIKARTEDLWYDYNENVTETVQSAHYEHTAPVNNDAKKGTVIPKRDIYKMSSPNYLVKLPIIAEKYDFNEPLPEKDREQEKLKPILGEERFAINGKVKLK